MRKTRLWQSAYTAGSTTVLWEAAVTPDTTVFPIVNLEMPFVLLL